MIAFIVAFSEDATPRMATRDSPGQVGDWTIEFVVNQSLVSLPPA